MKAKPMKTRQDMLDLLGPGVHERTLNPGDAAHHKQSFALDSDAHDKPGMQGQNKRLHEAIITQLETWKPPDNKGPRWVIAWRIYPNKENQNIVDSITNGSCGCGCSCGCS